MNSSNTRTGRSALGRWGLVCAVGAFLASPALGQRGERRNDVNVTDYGTVDLAVQDTDLSQVLQMLSIQSRKNIITSKQVSATVTANLYDVTFHEALDAILRVNGYGYTEEGNFIYIYTLEELAEIEAAMRQTTSRTYELDYLSATDASEFIAPLLSEAGKSSARGDVQTGFQPDISDGGADSYAYSAKLVVNDYPENLDEISRLLDELDTPPQQVLVECTVLQTALTETNEFGIDFTFLASLDFTDLTNPLSAVNNLIAGGTTPDESATDDEGFTPADNSALAVGSAIGNTASGAGGLKVGLIRDSVAVFIRVLDEVADTTVLARPKIMCLNRQRAEVLVGEKKGYLSTTATQTSTTQTVQFLDTGIHLVFRPFISKNGMIRLELAPSVSEAKIRTVESVSIPDEITNELTTNVRVQDGHTLVLGGLFKESTQITRRQVPFLGDIPILGLAFRGQDDLIVRDEIIFLITPTIVHDDVLWDIGNEGLAYADAIRVGARKGLLPFGRGYVTANYNQDAMDAFTKGDTKMAMYYTNISLAVNPNQPEMIGLREQVSGVKAATHDRSVMERVFRNTLGPLIMERPATLKSPTDNYEAMSLPRLLYLPGSENLVPYAPAFIGPEVGPEPELAPDWDDRIITEVVDPEMIIED